MTAMAGLGADSGARCGLAELRAAAWQRRRGCVAALHGSAMRMAAGLDLGHGRAERAAALVVPHVGRRRPVRKQEVDLRVEMVVMPARSRRWHRLAAVLWHRTEGYFSGATWKS